MTSIKRYLTPTDFTAAETWRLVEWCRAMGADEFTIDRVGSDARAEAKVWRPFEKVVKPFSRGEKSRERMSGPTADDLTRSTRLWALNPVTIGALQQALPNGLLAYDPAGRAWFEDPILYCDGNLLLGVLSHEAFAVLRISVLESVRLSAAGFPSHDSLPRVG
ncbi:MAG TPA: hypothetical protein DGB72_10350 [Gemmatimonadetes bacterium]|nr:hypothetical protein [Gemmatimonadota bacterium]